MDNIEKKKLYRKLWSKRNREKLKLRQREARQKLINEGKVILIKGICKICGKEFAPHFNRKAQKFCSKECSKKCHYFEYKPNKYNSSPEEYRRFLDKKNAKQRKRYQENKEKYLLKKKEYRKTHPHKYNSEEYFKYKCYYSEYYRQHINRYNMYKYNAKSRQLDFQITREQFNEIISKPCYYCGRMLETMGVDRIDNSKGYIQGNIFPACKSCNLAKRAMIKERFFEICKLICLKHNLIKIDDLNGKVAGEKRIFNI